MLVLHNVRMIPSNVRKKIREPLHVTKVQSHVMLVLHNMSIVPSNMRKKNKRITECHKSTVTCNVGTAQCEDGTIKYEKKIKELPNVTKIQSHVAFSVFMINGKSF